MKPGHGCWEIWDNTLIGLKRNSLHADDGTNCVCQFIKTYCGYKPNTENIACLPKGAEMAT